MRLKNLFIFISLMLLSVSIVFLFIRTNTSTDTPTTDYQQLKSRYGIFAIEIPTKLSFAGENVPVNTFYVYEQLDREILVNTYWQSNTILYFKRAYRYFPVIEEILKQEGVPDDFKYLALIESSLMNVTSPAGAKGYWQFLKKTGQSYGLQVDEYVDERLDIEKSTKAACKYLKEAYQTFGNWTLAAASYNMGMAGVSSQTKNQQSTSYYDLDLNSETERYIYRILAAKLIFENPKNHGFYLRDYDLYPKLDVEVETIDSSIENLSKFASDKKISYRMLKELNPWLTGNSLPNASKKSFKIYFPSNKTKDYSKLKSNLSCEIGVFGDKKQKK